MEYMISVLCLDNFKFLKRYFITYRNMFNSEIPLIVKAFKLRKRIFERCCCI